MGAPASESRDEIADKFRWWNSSTVDARLRDTFAPAGVRDAAVLLSALVGEVPGGGHEADDSATCRLMLGALKVSEGDLRTLALWVDYARRDPRDLIAAAEYRRELTTPTPEARLADLAEYLTWCAGATVYS